MLNVYLNYPQARVAFHGSQACNSVRVNDKPGQRVIAITSATLTEELARFRHKHYHFASQAALNDMWLMIDLGSRERDRAVAGEVVALLGLHYKRFREARVTDHC